MSNVLLAEELVSEAEREGERRSQEVREAVERAEEAVEAFEQASQLSLQALEVEHLAPDGCVFDSVLFGAAGSESEGQSKGSSI